MDGFRCCAVARIRKINRKCRGYGQGSFSARSLKDRSGDHVRTVDTSHGEKYFSLLCHFNRRRSYLQVDKELESPLHWKLNWRSVINICKIQIGTSALNIANVYPNKFLLNGSEFHFLFVLIDSAYNRTQMM